MPRRRSADVLVGVRNIPRREQEVNRPCLDNLSPHANLVLTFKNIKSFVFAAVPMWLGPSGGLHDGFEYRIRAPSLLSLYLPAAFRVRRGVHRLQLAAVWFRFLRLCV